jgi:imidazolonepropionase-like amidohydrolase
MRALQTALMALAIGAAPASAQLAIQGETVYTMAGRPIQNGVVLIGFHTDDGITDSRWFLRSAGLGIRAGLSRETALRAMTINGAKMLDLDTRTGSLEAGKDADLIILSGDPFSVYTHVEQTWVDGKKVFDLSDPRDALYARGGYDSIRDGIYEVHADMEDHN